MIYVGWRVNIYVDFLQKREYGTVVSLIVPYWRIKIDMPEGEKPLHINCNEQDIAIGVARFQANLTNWI